MGRAPFIDEALPSSSSRSPAMSRAHSLHSSASGPNAAGPSHHEHLVGPPVPGIPLPAPRPCTLLLQPLYCTPILHTSVPSTYTHLRNFSGCSWPDNLGSSCWCSSQRIEDHVLLVDGYFVSKGVIRSWLVGANAGALHAKTYDAYSPFMYAHDSMSKRLQVSCCLNNQGPRRFTS